MRVFIHPGYGRTATTTLQNHLFGVHSQILPLGRPWTDGTKAFLGEIKKRNSLYYDAEKVCGLRDGLINGENKKTIVLSDENLQNYKNREMGDIFLSRIKELVVDSEVLIIIRSQVDAIESFYLNHGRILKGVPEPFNGRHVTLEAWLKWSFDNWENSYFSHIDYNSHVTKYENIFGKGKVHVLLFEDFVGNQQRFITQLTSILNVDYEEAMHCVSTKHDNSSVKKTKIYVFSG